MWHRRGVSSAPGPTVHYDERLRVPWSWWVLGVVAGGLLVDEVDTTLIVGQVWGGWRAISIAFFVMVFVLWMLAMSMTRVAVLGDRLIAVGDVLPLAHVGQLHPVDDAMRRRLMGPHGNRLAHLATRPWIKSGLVLQIVEPGNPTPYWLVSTRHPQALAAAIAACRGAAAPSEAAPIPQQPA